VTARSVPNLPAIPRDFPVRFSHRTRARATHGGGWVEYDIEDGTRLFFG
jgi:hypothetical protein